MNTRKGFTLVELLVVIAILAILATVSVVGYTSFINRANESNAQTEAHQIESYINASLMSNEPCQLGTALYVVKTTTGTVVAGTSAGTGAPTYTLGGDFAGLKGAVSVKSMDHDNDTTTAAVSCLVYTLNGSDVIVVANVTVGQ